MEVNLENIHNSQSPHKVYYLNALWSVSKASTLFCMEVLPTHPPHVDSQKTIIIARKCI